jgi:thiamine biosynthesis lipoprotein ApbE
MAPTATASDALSTTLLLLSTEDGAALLSELAGVSAIWISPGGTLQASFRDGRLQSTE